MGYSLVVTVAKGYWTLTYAARPWWFSIVMLVYERVILNTPRNETMGNSWTFQHNWDHWTRVSNVRGDGITVKKWTSTIQW